MRPYLKCVYKFMKITFDPAKDAANIIKHGISLRQAADLVWDEAMVWEDNRMSYGEARMIALAPIGTRLFVNHHSKIFLQSCETCSSPSCCLPQ